jgi:hypothetical protein
MCYRWIAIRLFNLWCFKHAALCDVVPLQFHCRCVAGIVLACWQFVAGENIGDVLLMGGWWVAAIQVDFKQFIKFVCCSHAALCCSSVEVL